MRIAIITESFLPTVNGVSNSIARVTEQLELGGHEVLIVAPGSGPDRFSRSDVIRTPAIPLPGYTAIPVGIPGRTTRARLRRFQPDVVHVGGPIALGAWGLSVAARLGVPAVAVYQTDFARYTGHYRVGGIEALAWAWLRRIHGKADVTLAPSTPAARDLIRHGIPRVALWGRGVDGQQFNPRHRDARLRRQMVDDDHLLVGYIGRLAPEKDVGRLAALSSVPGIRLVVVGDGPAGPTLQQQLPDATFVGHQDGTRLSSLFASLDVFVHTGVHETFCQTIQEALSSGVPVIAPAVGGPVDLVDHGHNGLLFDPGDPEALRLAVTALVDNPASRLALTANARSSVAGRDWGTVTDELQAHYLRVCGLTPVSLPLPAPSVGTDGVDVIATDVVVGATGGR